MLTKEIKALKCLRSVIIFFAKFLKESDKKYPFALFVMKTNLLISYIYNFFYPPRST